MWTGHNFYFHKIFIIWPGDSTPAVSVAASHPPTVQLPASPLPSDQLDRLLEIDWNLSNITDRSLIKYLMFSCSIYTPNTSFTKITIRCFKRFKIFWWTQNILCLFTSFGIDQFRICSLTEIVDICWFLVSPRLGTLFWISSVKIIISRKIT